MPKITSVPTTVGLERVRIFDLKNGNSLPRFPQNCRLRFLYFLNDELDPEESLAIGAKLAAAQLR